MPSDWRASSFSILPEVPSTTTTSSPVIATPVTLMSTQTAQLTGEWCTESRYCVQNELHAKSDLFSLFCLLKHEICLFQITLIRLLVVNFLLHAEHFTHDNISSLTFVFTVVCMCLEHVGCWMLHVFMCLVERRRFRRGARVRRQLTSGVYSCDLHTCMHAVWICMNVNVFLYMPASVCNFRFLVIVYSTEEVYENTDTVQHLIRLLCNVPYGGCRSSIKQLL